MSEHNRPHISSGGRDQKSGTDTDNSSSIKKSPKSSHPLKRGQVWQNVSRGRSRVVTVEVKRKPRLGKPFPGARRPSGGPGQLVVPARNSQILTEEERRARRAALQAGNQRALSRPAPSASAAFTATPPARQAPGRISRPGDGGDTKPGVSGLDKGRTFGDGGTGRAIGSGVGAGVGAGDGAPSGSARAATRKEPAALPGADKTASGKKVKTQPGPERKGKRARPTPERPERAQKRGGSVRREGKLTIVQALDSEIKGERVRSLAALRRAREREKIKAREQQQSAASVSRQSRDIIVPDTISVSDLANRMAVRGADVIKSLMGMGLMVTINEQIDADTAELIVDEFGHRSKRVSESDVEIGLGGQDDNPASLEKRPPVVVVIGHVDHGKTSLLDALRESDVAGSEAGGITQHIGACSIRVGDAQDIIFLDTPGHEAFRAMRERGAKVTDIAVLVIAADDGVQPQTIEAIEHAKAASIPIVVAVNKMDAPGADADKVYQELLRHSVIVEKLSGDTLAVEISAKKKQNINKLTEAIVLQAELLDLKGNPHRSATGAVIEARMKKGQGSVATILVQRGTLRVGDIFVSGWQWGKVRALFDQNGERISSASLSMPVEVLGFSGPPEAGDDFIGVENEARAREIARYREDKVRSGRPATVRSSMDEMLEQKGKEKISFPLIIKADARGSIDALEVCLDALSNDRLQVLIVGKGIGDVNESDVASAVTLSAKVIAFNVRNDKTARDLAKRDDIEILPYNIIYNVVEDMKKRVEKLSKKDDERIIIGRAEVLKVFDIGKLGKVAGSNVLEGVMKKGAKVRLLRGEETVLETDIVELRREKDTVHEVKHGLECGISLSRRDHVQEGDIIECFMIGDNA